MGREERETFHYILFYVLYILKRKQNRVCLGESVEKEERKEQRASRGRKERNKGSSDHRTIRKQKQGAWEAGLGLAMGENLHLGTVEAEFSLSLSHIHH